MIAHSAYAAVIIGFLGIMMVIALVPHWNEKNANIIKLNKKYKKLAIV